MYLLLFPLSLSYFLLSVFFVLSLVSMIYLVKLDKKLLKKFLIYIFLSILTMSFSRLILKFSHPSSYLTVFLFYPFLISFYGFVFLTFYTYYFILFRKINAPKYLQLVFLLLITFPFLNDVIVLIFSTLFVLMLKLRILNVDLQVYYAWLHNYGSVSSILIIVTYVLAGIIEYKLLYKLYKWLNLPWKPIYFLSLPFLDFLYPYILVRYHNEYKD